MTTDAAGEPAPPPAAGRAGRARKLGGWLARWWLRAPDGRMYHRRQADALVAAAGLAVVVVCGVLVANRLVAGTDVAVFRRINHWPGGCIRRAAVQQQLGLTVLDVKPVGLEGSAGSTPLRLRVAATGEAPERDLFAKLYTKSHVRADRSYKLGRTILYGALEDEAPFQSVRRFVEYEDYTLLRLAQVGIQRPRRSGSWRSPRNGST